MDLPCENLAWNLISWAGPLCPRGRRNGPAQRYMSKFDHDNRIQYFNIIFVFCQFYTSGLGSRGNICYNLTAMRV